MFSLVFSYVYTYITTNHQIMVLSSIPEEFLTWFSGNTHCTLHLPSPSSLDSHYSDFYHYRLALTVFELYINGIIEYVHYLMSGFYAEHYMHKTHPFFF